MRNTIKLHLTLTVSPKKKILFAATKQVECKRELDFAATKQVECKREFDFQNVALLPTGRFRWLSRRNYVAISGPGNGSEIQQWISRLERNVPGRSALDGVAELRSALEDQRFQLVLRDMINLARSNSINCSTELAKTSPDCFISTAGLRLLRGARNLVRLNRDFLEEIVSQALDARNASEYELCVFGCVIPFFFSLKMLQKIQAFSLFCMSHLTIKHKA